MLWGLLAALILGGLGVGLMVYSAIEPLVHVSIFLFTAGLYSIACCGIVAFSMCWKRLSKNAGLVINRQGITFQGELFVPWSDIEEIRDFEISRQKFLVPIVKNPQEVIDRITNPLTRKMAKMSFGMCGSPFSIVTNSLKIKLDDLRDLLVEKMN